MRTRYVCDSSDRRAQLIARNFLASDGTPLNAIDFLEVLDGALDEVGTPQDDPRQLLLLVRFMRPIQAAQLDASMVVVSGGTTVTAIRVLAAARLLELPANPTSSWSAVALSYLQKREGELAAEDAAEPTHWLAVRVNQRGDYSRYRLELVAGVASSEPPANFDPILSRVHFFFKVECPADFDCEQPLTCSQPMDSAPPLDYLARDYQSFRRLMLDRLSVKLPDWDERNPADLGVTLVEMLAYAADRAAYFQDAVATEAYLGTARLRTSVRRHARLLDYVVHEGCNARAWVHLPLIHGQVLGLPNVPALQRGTRFLTAIPGMPATVASAREAEALEHAPEVFEALHDVPLLSYVHNEMRIYTWGEERCVLPKGATSAALCPVHEGEALTLAAGDVLVFEEVVGPESRSAADADPERRHAVRLTSVSPTPKTDPLYGVPYWEVQWHEQDALPFPLCLWEVGGSPTTVARGNIVLVDHGRSHHGDSLVPPEVPIDGRYRPRLPREHLTWRVPYGYDPQRSASYSQQQNPRQALPALALADERDSWEAVAELLGSDPFARKFVVEMESDGHAYVRFGDGVLGRRPARATRLLAKYRTGRGSQGNVGPETIRHIVGDDFVGAIASVRNPLAAVGGQDAEPLEAVKLKAPQAFRTQMRAVTTDDWSEVAGRHPAVQRAVATIRFTGSWNTVYLTVDPRDGRPLDDQLREELLEFLEPFRLAGVDLELRPPAYVPLDVALVMCISPDHYAHDVEQAAFERLSAGLRKDGSSGLFHPDQLTFGQDIYLSPIVAELMKIDGVRWVDLDPVANGSEQVRFQRLRQVASGELEAGVIRIGRLEVARLDNDPSAPDNGRLRLTVRGGR